MRYLNYLEEDTLSEGTFLRLPNSPEIRTEVLKTPPTNASKPEKTTLVSFREADLAADRLEIETAAISAKKFVYVKVEKNQTLADIATEHRVRLSTLKELNHLISDQIESGTYLRMPDMNYRPR